jgi:lipopolysaccharide transport system ATP-binding protein
MIVLKVENLSKQYALGAVGYGYFYKDLQRWWARTRGKEDPHATVREDAYQQGDTGRFWALKDVSFEINRGEKVGIVGLNGAGKSTLLKILARVTAPTEGTVKIKGRMSSLLEVGAGFHPELTGKENIYLNGAILGMTKREIESRFDLIVAFAGLERFLETPVKRYSSGMYVRLAFAVAAHLASEILAVDEVLASGDMEFQQKCFDKMDDISQEGRTVLFVSHNMETVKKLCARGILLRQGQIAYQGKIEDVVERYRGTNQLPPSELS